MDFIARPKWTYWLITVLGILWYAMGAMDYVMVKFQVEAYMAALTAEDLAFLNASPVWYSAAWAVSIWGAVLATLAMLVRSKWAALLFVVSLIGYGVACLWTFVVSDMPRGNFESTFSYVLNVMIFASLLFFIWYTRRQLAKGVLR